jgi:hypothetical protein
MFDMLPKSKVLDFLKPATKNNIIDELEKKEISTYFNKPYKKNRTICT